MKGIIFYAESSNYWGGFYTLLSFFVIAMNGAVTLKLKRTTKIYKCIEFNSTVRREPYISHSQHLWSHHNRMIQNWKEAESLG